MVNIDACGMHEVWVFDEALSCSWVGMDVVGISKYVLLDAAEGWYTETVKLKYSSSYW